LLKNDVAIKKSLLFCPAEQHQILTNAFASAFILQSCYRYTYLCNVITIILEIA